MTGEAKLVVILSTYDLGRVPVGVASATALLRGAGLEVVPVDLSRGELEGAPLERASLVVFSLPMHTATRLALACIPAIRSRTRAPIAAFGLYAALSRETLVAAGIDHVLSRSPDADLLEAAGVSGTTASIGSDTRGLPAPEAYAHVHMPDGTQRSVGVVEATRGCLHHCGHCPIVPVWGGSIEVIPVDVVARAAAEQVARGARHITFADPDFLNGPGHARRVVEAIAMGNPGVTFDATAKVEHLLRRREMLPWLRDQGFLFFTTAIESTHDPALALLQKRHTRRDVFTLVDVMDKVGLALAPTFLPFAPWETLASYRQLLVDVDALGLVPQVTPVQLAIRLLLVPGSPLLDIDSVRRRAGALDATALSHPWSHEDPAMDALADEAMRVVTVATREPRSREETYRDLCAIAGLDRKGAGAPPRATVPFLDEPWYC